MRPFHNFMKNPDFSAKSGPVCSKKSGSGPKSGNPDQSGGTAKKVDFSEENRRIIEEKSEVFRRKMYAFC